jgi:DNA polymerase-3 subunit beta
MATIHISRNKLKAAAIFAASKDVRFYLCGVLIESTPMQTRICATDGHALFCAKDDAKGDNDGTFIGIVPNDTIKQILAWKAPYKGAADLPVVITTAETEQRAEWCGNTAVFKLIDAKFPEYARVVPGTVSGDASYIDPELLMKCKKAAEALGTNKFGHFAFKQGGDGSAIAVFSSEAFAVVMPMRGDKADVADVAWAREALPVTAA